MGSAGERRAAWHHRTVIHLILLTGAAFFLLPLLWMVATSLKPLDQTMQQPDDLATAFVATGYWVEIDGREYDVTLDRPIDLVKEGPLHIVRPKPVAKGTEARAGELTLPFGPDLWESSPSFADHELAQMDKPVNENVKVLADRNNRYDSATDKLHFRSGRIGGVQLVRTIEPPKEPAVLTHVRDHVASRKAVDDELIRRAEKLDLAAVVRLLRNYEKSERAGDDELIREARKSGHDDVLRLVRDYLDSKRVGDAKVAGKIDQAARDSIPLPTLVNPWLLNRSRLHGELLREVKVYFGLWLVREWRPVDTNTKGVSSPFVDVGRAWDIVPRERIRTKPKFIPQNYPFALERVHFKRSLGNTLLLCLMTVCGTVVSSVIVAYGFAFLEFPGRKALFALTLTTIMVPFVVTMVPVYMLYRSLGWVGTFKPLWVATWFGNAFFIFLLRQFFLGIPKDLLDAARIDGCTELEILWKVVAPLSRPVIAMVALFTFLGTWKDFLGPLLYLNHESQFTLSLSLQTFQSEHGGTPWHLLMAASTVFSLPLIILFFFAMKTFIRSVAMTGLKG